MRTIFNFTSFLRFLSRNKLFTAVNVFGFAVSLMFVVLLGLYIQDELSVNASQPNKDRIYRLRTEEFGAFPAALDADIKARYPEIEATLRTHYEVSAIDNGISEQIRGEMLLVDSSFLTMFKIPFIEGNAASAMRTKADILLSAECARKLFGAESAMGKTVKIQEQQMVVSGVFRDLDDTHFKTPDVIARFENVTSSMGQNILTDYGHCAFSLYVMTIPNAELTDEKVAQMKAFLMDIYAVLKIGMAKEFFAEPLVDVYYTDTIQVPQDIRGNDKSFLAVLGATALLILLFAVINYINLSVAQAGFRAQEAAMRRLLGGSKESLFIGFIIESLIVATVALFFGIMFASLVEPWFQQVMQTEVAVNDIFTLINIALALGGLMVIGVVSGLVPATVLTRFKPIDVVRGSFRRQTKMVYSKVLIVFQYCITIVLLVSTITIMRQLNFMRNSDLGFNKENILLMSYALGDNMSVDGLRNRLSSVAGVERIGFVDSSPFTGAMTSGHERDGKMRYMTILHMDSVAFDIMGFTPLRHTAVAYGNGIWLNEAAWKDHELADDATEFKLDDHNSKLPIIGMLKNFHIGTMEMSIKPAMIVPSNFTDRDFVHVVVKIAGANQLEVADRVKKAYLDYNKGEAFSLKFADELIRDQYAAQERMSWIIGVMAMLAILISALGMLAMATYFARQKAQEVAVRKVFGASGAEVLSLMMMNFLKLVLIAFVIAVPIGWYFMSDWLNGYVYRIDLSWGIFAIAGGSALLVASVTVLWQSLRAVRANPVKAIKD